MWKSIPTDAQLLQLSGIFHIDIQPYVSVIHLKSGEQIFQQGNTPNKLYYLIRGRTKIIVTEENGRETLSNFVESPAFIGEMELLGARATTNQVVAVTSCTCYEINYGQCREQLLNDAAFLRVLCMDLSRRFVKESANASKNLTYSLETRLANFIMKTAVGNLYKEKHTEAAAFLGVSYRHFLYVLAGFVHKGILEKAEKGYKILDPAALQRIARE